MNTYRYTGKYSNGEAVIPWVKQYPNRRLALMLQSPLDGPMFHASVNLPDEDCPIGELWVKDWSENEGMRDFLVAKGIISAEPTAWTTSGYVKVSRHKLLLAQEP